MSRGHIWNSGDVASLQEKWLHTWQMTPCCQICRDLFTNVLENTLHIIMVMNSYLCTHDAKHEYETCAYPKCVLMFATWVYRGATACKITIYVKACKFRIIHYCGYVHHDANACVHIACAYIVIARVHVVVLRSNSYKTLRQDGRRSDLIVNRMINQTTPATPTRTANTAWNT